MTLNISKDSFVVFDLDDTLYSEYDYLCSAYREIDQLVFSQLSISIYDEMLMLWSQKKDVFDAILNKYALCQTKSELISIYRLHKPIISPFSGVDFLLANLKKHSISIGVLTDGRSITQRNKLQSLGIIDLFDEVVISEEIGYEKPAIRNFEYFMNNSNKNNFFYIGDNFSKDFVSPNILKWTTIGIRGGENRIHAIADDIKIEFLPIFEIDTISDLKIQI